jgi:integrase
MSRRDNVENLPPLRYPHCGRSVSFKQGGFLFKRTTYQQGSLKLQRTACENRLDIMHLSYGVGWHTFQHTVGTLLAEMGEHQLTIRDYLRHSNLSVTNKYLQAASSTKRKAQDKLVEAILPVKFQVKTAEEAVAP